MADAAPAATACPEPLEGAAPSENESSAQNPEPADALLESKALPCRPQIGLPINTGSVENSRKEDDASEDQDVARPGEKLADQIQPLKERTPTRINTMLKIAAGFIRLFLKRWDIGRLAEPRSYPKEAIVQMTNYRVPQGPGDIVMIQSEHTGAVDILSAELETADLLGEQRKAQPPPLAPASTWTTCKMKEFKTKMGKEKNGRMVVKRGEVVTVRVPTHPDGKRVCWEFATDDYDIGFGVYFDWTPVTSTAITVQVSESSDEEDEEEEEEIEGLTPAGDVERGSKSYLRNRYGEIMPVYRRDSHRDVQAGSHDYPGEGIYLLKFDNSYSLLRNKILFFHVYYTS
ncbi:PREDICTED: protein TMED8 isoform X2 [Crocodylus porosus]|uniref:protein TMED8 isoform X2 n=1 Tax=Crocodylus porosus TaxID=8502 RepID=UPI00093E6B65|nr:PREDICTED: protein TMED8 isoform X2 [Crocodylus porosus]